MKGNVSRLGFREDRHYSGVFQIQGGLVTDADLGEQAAIARNRTDLLGLDTAGSGVPETGGIIDLAGPKLVPGIVFAEGVRGVVEATGATPGALSLYGKQKDFPKAPDLPGAGDFFLYADVWERTVTHLEDALLSDAGFHGAETALRQMTIAQIKFAPLDQLEELGAEDGPLPRQGCGLLTATAVDPAVIADDCDPCADTVAAEQLVANALFRIEVVHVHGTPQAPDRIVIAWSAENAAAVARKNVNPEDFERAGAVYEMFSPITDTHLGVHTANSAVARSTFIEAVADAPNPANGPDGNPWPFIRRWSGKAEIDFGAGTAAKIGSGGVAVNGREVTITTDMLTAKLDFDGKAIVAGDFWLIETRRFAADRIRVVSQAPIGIRHHYCPLLRIKNAAIEALSDAETRRLSFPTLPDIPATHVSFDNVCENRFPGAENVQEALAALCVIKAEDISFDPTGCPRLYDDVGNVQAALNNLCKVDFGIERYLRLMQDWGVVCGVIPNRVSAAEVAWSGGAILDRTGNLGDVRNTSIKVAKIISDGGNGFASEEALAAALRTGDACLALTIETGGVIKPHLVPKARAFGPADATFMSLFTKCRDAKKFDFKENFAGVAESKKTTVYKMMVSGSSKALAGSQGLTASEEKVASKYNDDLLASYKTHIGDDPIAKTLDAKVAAIREEFSPAGATGAAKEALALKTNAGIYVAIRETEEERIRRCLCDALLPRCPTVGDPPHFVPIACLTGMIVEDDIRIDEVCAYCCRKQAITWRTVQYFISEMRDDIARDLETYCCHQKPKKTRPDYKIPDILLDKMLKADFDPQMYAMSMTRGVSIIAGAEPPTKYSVRPKVNELGIEEAKTILAGDGVDVVDTIRAGDRDAVAKLRERSSIDADDLVRENRSVSPGDKVALIVENGVAVDYVKVESGGGKNLFDRPSGAVAVPDVDFEGKADAALAGFEEKIAAKVAELDSAGTDFDTALTRRKEEVAAAGADLARIGETRAGVAAEIESLRNDITRLRAERETIARDIGSAAAELDRVRTVHDDVNREVAVVKGELASIVELQRTTLADAAREREKLVESIRRETPVSAVTGTEGNFGNALVNRGVTNVGGLAGLSDTDLEAVARESGLNVSTARRLRREADARIGAPIR
jgi:hypothetical protein